MKLLLTGLVLALGANAQFDCRTREVWSAQKRAWCCTNTGLGCPTPEAVSVPALNVLPETAEAAVVDEHDCRTRELWLPNKKAWCCANKGLGCPPVEVVELVETPAAAEATVEDEYNCRSREAWLPKKKAWCCANKGLGCPPAEPATAAAVVDEHDCRTRELWLPNKKAWCCANKGLGCPPAEAVETPDTAEATVEDVPVEESVSERSLVEEFDCTTKELWLTKKKAWCCANKNLGCDVEKPSRGASLSVGKPRFLSMAERLSSSATLIWVPPEGTVGCAAVEYTIKIREKGTKKFDVVRRAGAQDTSSTDPIHTFDNLIPDTAYEVRVITGTGKDVASSRKIFRTLPER